MKNRQIWTKFIIFAVLIAGISSVAFFTGNIAVTDSSTNKNISSNGKNLKGAVAAQDKNNNEDAETKLTSDDWNKESFKLARAKNIKRLSEENYLALYEKGYGLADIEKAEEVSALCGKTPEEVLEIKGKTGVVNAKKVKASQTPAPSKKKTSKEILNQINLVQDFTYDESVVIKDTSKSWETVVNELGINVLKQADIIVIPKEDIQKMKGEGESDNQIIDIASLTDRFNKDYRDVWNEFRKGKTVEAIKSQYAKEMSETSTNSHNSTQSINEQRAQEKESFDNALKRECNITDDEIELCKQYGINELIDVAHAKDIAFKGKTTLENVLKIKKNKSWNDVMKTLGVNSNEK